MKAKAIQYSAYGNYEENRLVELDRPQPSDGEVLVKMHTVGINPLDNTFRSGHIFFATRENLPRVGGQPGLFREQACPAMPRRVASGRTEALQYPGTNH